MSKRTSVNRSRRQVLKASAAAGVGFWVAGRGAWADVPAAGAKVSANEKLNVAFVGVNNRAAADLEETSKLPNVNVVGLCDIDDKYLEKAAKAHPGAKTYNDFRKMLEAEKSVDAVVVATPDHVHAFAAMAAMKLGKHVYCEKPLTHAVSEARALTEYANQNKRVTQMGTQIHAGRNYRRVVELIQSGAIGAVTEVHVLCEKSWGTTKRATPTEQIPPNIHYDLWVGPSAFRPYSAEYLPANWRKYWNFGSGSLGDMGCHYIDLVFWSLGLKYPTRVSAESATPPDAENCPPALQATWEFPARGSQPPVKLTWYDGALRPKQAAEWNIDPKWKYGVIFIGEKGICFADYSMYKLLPQEKFADYTPPKPTIPDSVGHHKEWVEACIRNDYTAPLCRFDYSGPLSETVLLGTVAFRTGKTLEWDAKNLKATNCPEADAIIRPTYREGWVL